jgi:hypothetical protein
MKFAPVTILMTGLVLVLCAGVGTTKNAVEEDVPMRDGVSLRASLVRNPAEARAEAVYESGNELYGPGTQERADPVWIYEANFDLDGGGWTSYDMSYGVDQVHPKENFWGRDTVRMRPLDPAFDYLDDPINPDGVPYSWWCGTTNDCWEQSRGYGNDWECSLERHFDAADLPTGTGLLWVEFDQRFAMDARQNIGDFGYFEVSRDGFDTWESFGWEEGLFGIPPYVAHNTVPVGGGDPHDWDSATYGHVSLDLWEYAAQHIDVRFRFRSDNTHSCADDPVNARKSSEDGAWQIDNITFYDGPPGWPGREVLWSDDCETGENGWTHDFRPSNWHSGQQFAWGMLGTPPFLTGADYSCGTPPSGSGVWWSAHPGPQMANWAWTWLVSPPIDISGLPPDATLVAQWNMWIDFPANSHTSYSLSLASCDSPDVDRDLSLFVDEQPG